MVGCQKNAIRDHSDDIRLLGDIAKIFCSSLKMGMQINLIRLIKLTNGTGNQDASIVNSSIAMLAKFKSNKMHNFFGLIDCFQ